MNFHNSMLHSLVDSIIRKRNLSVHFQPIVNLRNQSIYGYEGLIRGPVNTILYSPEMLFEAATKYGCLAQLDFLCRELVIMQFSRLNLPGCLFINVDPSVSSTTTTGKERPWIGSKRAGLIVVRSLSN